MSASRSQGSLHKPGQSGKGHQRNSFPRSPLGGVPILPVREIGIVRKSPPRSSSPRQEEIWRLASDSVISNRERSSSHSKAQKPVKYTVLDPKSKVGLSNSAGKLNSENTSDHTGLELFVTPPNSEPIYDTVAPPEISPKVKKKSVFPFRLPKDKSESKEDRSSGSDSSKRGSKENPDKKRDSLEKSKLRKPPPGLPLKPKVRLRNTAITGEQIDFRGTGDSIESYHGEKCFSRGTTVTRVAVPGFSIKGAPPASPESDYDAPANITSDIVLGSTSLKRNKNMPANAPVANGYHSEKISPHNSYHYSGKQNGVTVNGDCDYKHNGPRINNEKFGVKGGLEGKASLTGSLNYPQVSKSPAEPQSAPYYEDIYDSVSDSSSFSSSLDSKPSSTSQESSTKGKLSSPKERHDDSNSPGFYDNLESFPVFSPSPKGKSPERIVKGGGNYDKLEVFGLQRPITPGIERPTTPLYDPSAIQRSQTPNFDNKAFGYGKQQVDLWGNITQNNSQTGNYDNLEMALNALSFSALMASPSPSKSEVSSPTSPSSTTSQGSYYPHRVRSPTSPQPSPLFNSSPTRKNFPHTSPQKVPAKRLDDIPRSGHGVSPISPTPWKPLSPTRNLGQNSLPKQNKNFTPLPKQNVTNYMGSSLPRQYKQNGSVTPTNLTPKFSSQNNSTSSITSASSTSTLKSDTGSNRADFTGSKGRVNSENRETWLMEELDLNNLSQKEKDLALKHQINVAERKREEKQQMKERMRLEEILNMCSEYQKQLDEPLGKLPDTTDSISSFTGTRNEKGKISTSYNQNVMAKSPAGYSDAYNRQQGVKSKLDSSVSDSDIVSPSSYNYQRTVNKIKTNGSLGLISSPKLTKRDGSSFESQRKTFSVSSNSDDDLGSENDTIKRRPPAHGNKKDLSMNVQNMEISRRNMTSPHRFNNGPVSPRLVAEYSQSLPLPNVHSPKLHSPNLQNPNLHSPNLHSPKHQLSPRNIVTSPVSPSFQYPSLGSPNSLHPHTTQQLVKINIKLLFILAIDEL